MLDQLADSTTTPRSSASAVETPRRPPAGPDGGSDYVRAILNILEDFAAEKERMSATQRAVLNVLEDASGERSQLEAMHRALLNILEDASAEKSRLEETQRAVLNILDDFTTEKARLEELQTAVINILDDFAAEKGQLVATQRAILNILDDFEAEKFKVEAANEELRREIAERQSAEQALKRTNAELEQFAYVASHDLQEPLRMVSSYVALFAKRFGGQVDPQSQKYIQYAVDGAQRMRALINALLEFSRAGRALQPATVDARAALDQALLNLATTLEETGARVTLDPLPSVVADPNQLVQLFQNLLANAIKFRNPAERPRIRVSARQPPHAGMVEFAVADNGIGIDPKYSDRIFVIFQRLHTREEYPGTGIGLAICKKVVERQGGHIWVESQAGKGATFKFTLPGRPRAAASRGAESARDSHP